MQDEGDDAREGSTVQRGEQMQMQGRTDDARGGRMI